MVMAVVPVGILHGRVSPPFLAVFEEEADDFFSILLVVDTHRIVLRYVLDQGLNQTSLPRTLHLIIHAREPRIEQLLGYRVVGELHGFPEHGDAGVDFGIIKLPQMHDIDLRLCPLPRLQLDRILFFLFCTSYNIRVVFYQVIGDCLQFF